MGRLFCGDNLEILRQYVPDESVDLIYLDPPFNSNRAFNVIFKDESGRDSDAQIVSFDDFWHWGPTADSYYQYLTNSQEHGGEIPPRLSAVVAGLRTAIGQNQMMAYLVEMAVRLAYFHRVMKPTGSLYLHCDPTASHYLKLVLDAIFEPTNFRNEIIWKRSHGHNSARRYGASHDTLLFYSKGPKPIWNRVYQAYDTSYLEKHYSHVDDDGRIYKRENPTGPGISKGPSGQPWHGINPTPKGRHWAYTPPELDRLEAKGLIYWPDKEGAWPYIKLYLADMPGVPAQDVWTDIDPINMIAQERLGYPTQKPLALLKRIIEASSKVGDVVLDPFCGCGTALEAADELERDWIGIDISWFACDVMRERLRKTRHINVEIQNEPKEQRAVVAMAQESGGGFKVQRWVLHQLRAAPVSGYLKRGADRGIDGERHFTDQDGRLRRIIYSVKSGHVNPAMVRELRGVIERERAAMGVFVTVERPSPQMQREADEAGTFPQNGQRLPRLQIFPTADLFKKRQPIVPSTAQLPPQRLVDKEIAEQLALALRTPKPFVYEDIKQRVRDVRRERAKAREQQTREATQTDTAIESPRRVPKQAPR